MKKRLIVNTALLTGASLLMRCIGMVFQAWLAGRIGAAGIGLYQLVMSVEVLATTFAISGIRFAATRLVAEEIGLGRGSGVGGAMYRCAAYSLIFGAAACGILYIFAEPIGFLWIGDARTVMSLRILSFGLPFIALSSVLSGYFTACGRKQAKLFLFISFQLRKQSVELFRRVSAGQYSVIFCIYRPHFTPSLRFPLWRFQQN